MRTINRIIVEAEETYNNEKKFENGNSLIVNISIENVEYINRRVKVKSAPSFTVLQEGDEVIIHHNILRLRNGLRGEEVQSDYHFRDNLYYVSLTEVFMYKRGDSDWIALDPYCFVKPIKREQFLMGISEEFKDSYKGMVKSIGVMKYPNKTLLELGVRHNDEILFSENSEYEFNIDGEIYYKMSTNDILGVYERS